MKIIPTYTKKEISSEELEKTSERFMQAMFEDELRKKWKQQLQDGHQVERVAKGGRRVSLQWAIGIAASLALLLTMWFVLTPAQPSKEELLAVYMQEKFGNSETRKEGIIGNELRLEAISAFENTDFARAATLRQQLVDQDSALIKEDFFYLGLSYLYQQPPNTTSAVQYLRQTSEMPGRKFAAESRWSLALAYLLQGDDDLARPILEEIATEEWKPEAAARLLEVMDDK